jgi:hypothetical protein
MNDAKISIIYIVSSMRIPDSMDLELLNRLKISFYQGDPFFNHKAFLYENYG